MEKKLFIICGLSATGKSYWANVIMDMLKDNNSALVDFDIIREETWGKRAKNLVKEEHWFKNELTRNAIRKAFVVDEVKTVVTIVSMSTREQKIDMMNMVWKTEKTLTEILRQRREKECKKSEGEEAKIKVLALWFDCDDKTAEKRLARRKSGEEPSPSDLTEMSVWLGNKSWFDKPDGRFYPYVRIDTSEETIESDEKIKSQLRDALNN